MTSGLLFAITLELWFQRIIVTNGPAPQVPQFLLLSWFAGSFVAARLGGLRAVTVVGLYALAAISVTVARFVIEPLLQCALIHQPGCPPRPFDLITGTPWIVEALTSLIWMVPGLLLGSIAGRWVRVAIPAPRGLAAVSVFAICGIALSHLLFVTRYTICFGGDFVARCSEQDDLFSFVAQMAFGIGAGLLLVRFGGRPADAIAVGGLRAVALLPAPFHQLAGVWRDGTPAVLGFLSSEAGALTFVAVAVLLTVRSRSSRTVGAPAAT